MRCTALFHVPPDAVTSPEATLAGVLSGTPYENTEGCWDYLNEASKQARYLRLVSPEAIVDHRNPAPQIYMGLRGSPGDGR
jgi:hypothetical protein